MDNSKNVMPDLIRHPEQLFSVVLLGLCLIFLSGCIIPYPHFKQTCGPLCGYVVTKDPNVPIENALVKASYPDGGYRKTYTDQSGYFSFPTKNRFHWGVLFGVALNHSLPFDEYLDGYAGLNIIAKGYDDRTILIGRQGFSRFIDDPNDFYLSDGIVECPVLRVTRENNEIPLKIRCE